MKHIKTFESFLYEAAGLQGIKIGSQTWATEDLKVTKFRNGEPIPLVTSSKADGREWARLKSAAYCITPDGNYLYNWFAVSDPRGLAPAGWRVPSDADWQKLVDELGGKEVAGEALKAAAPAWDGTNSSGFSALPAGSRSAGDGYISNRGDFGHWWSSSPDGADARSRGLFSGYSKVYRGNNPTRTGFSVRCIK